MESRNDPEILEAVDSHFWNYRELLRKHIKIKFVCEEHIRKSSKAKNDETE